MKRYFEIPNPFWCLDIRLRAFKQRFSQKVRYKLISLLTTEDEKELVSHAIEDIRDYHNSRLDSIDLADRQMHLDFSTKIYILGIKLKQAGFYDKKRTVW